MDTPQIRQYILEIVLRDLRTVPSSPIMQAPKNLPTGGMDYEEPPVIFNHTTGTLRFSMESSFWKGIHRNEDGTPAKTMHHPDGYRPLAVDPHRFTADGAGDKEVRSYDIMIRFPNWTGREDRATSLSRWVRRELDKVEGNQILAASNLMDSVLNDSRTTVHCNCRGFHYCGGRYEASITYPEISAFPIDIIDDSWGPRHRDAGMPSSGIPFCKHIIQVVNDYYTNEHGIRDAVLKALVDWIENKIIMRTPSGLGGYE